MIVRQKAEFVVVVPARGGSKGVFRKNLRMLAGRPLLAWTIAAIDSAQAQLRCVVTSEDDEILALAEGLGAEIVRRPKHLATDQSPTEPALVHALEAMETPDDVRHIVLMQATSPIRHQGTLDLAIAQYRSADVDSLVGVVAQPPFLWRGPIDSPSALYDPGLRPRRQDLKPTSRTYRETGSLYITSVAGLLESRNRISGRVSLFVMAEDEGLDIDTEADLMQAQHLMGGEADAYRK